MKEAPSSSETSVLTRATRRNNPEDTILHSHRRENLKSYKHVIAYTHKKCPELSLQGYQHDILLRFGIFTAVTMKNAHFSDVNTLWLL
jgi:hypothetical protein